MRRVAEQALTLNEAGRFWVRIHPPAPGRNGNWRCQIENPLWSDVPMRGSGATALQAISLSLARLSVNLYAARQYDLGEPRVDGAADNDLGIPAVDNFLHVAPFPFSRSRVTGRSRVAVVNDAGWDVRLLAEELYDVAGSRRKMPARLYAPRLKADGRTWSCSVSVGAPLGMRGEGEGRSSLQALTAGLAILSEHLYGSSLYKAGRLGWAVRGGGEFGGTLVLPAVTEVLDVAPYPF